VIKGFHHFAVKTTDIERSAQFYRDVLGMREKMRLSFDDGSYLVMLALGETSVELFGGAKPKDPNEDRGEVGYVHLALTVDDVDAEYERIKALGYSFYIEPRTFKNLRVAFFRDPDGIPIELLQEL
jgi:catechol 2,3-dioxygenase-like lactoylglutathione lyase family enzyme